MKSRKFWLIGSGVLAVLMIAAILYSVFCPNGILANGGFTEPVHKKTEIRKTWVQKDGFVPGTDSITEIEVDETQGLNGSEGSMEKGDNYQDNGQQSNAPKYDLTALEYAPKFYVRAGNASTISKGMADAAVKSVNGNRLSAEYTFNNVRLAKKMQSFMNGGTYTIGFIGGSITEGSNASTEINRYANLTTEWFRDSFPRATFNIKNAGIGATDSYVGVHRVQNDLLKSNPDIVFVEYAVNDSGSYASTAYESLVRKIWNSPKKPAVILITTAMVNTSDSFISNKEPHWEIGKFYQLPVVSTGDAFEYTCTKEKLARWSDLIAADRTHPNDAGHSAMAQCIESYLYSVATDAVKGKITGAESDFSKTLYGDQFAGAKLLQVGNTTPTKISGFTADKSLYRNFNGVWRAAKAGAVIEFDVTAKNIGLLYMKYNTAETEHKPGKAQVYIDGKMVEINSATEEVTHTKGQGLTFAPTADNKHHIKIVVPSGDFELQGLLIS